MSFILDALKKAERQRPPGPVPDLFVVHGPLAPLGGRSTRAIVAGALLLAGVALLVWVWPNDERGDGDAGRAQVDSAPLRRTAAPTAPVPAAKVRAAPAPRPRARVTSALEVEMEQDPEPEEQSGRASASRASASRATAARRSAEMQAQAEAQPIGAMAAPAAPMPSPFPSPSPSPSGVPAAAVNPLAVPAPAPGVQLVPPILSPPPGEAPTAFPGVGTIPVPAAAPPTAPLTAPPTVAVPGPAPTAVPSPVLAPEAAAPADGRVLTVDELPASVRAQLPRLIVSGHVWSDDPALRMITVDDRIIREGGQAAPGVHLKEITAAGAVFAFQGWRIRVAGGGRQ